MSSISDGMGFIVKHADGDYVRNIQVGLQKLSNQYSQDGLPIGYIAGAVTHIQSYLQDLLPSVKVTAAFPKFVLDEDGNVVETIQVPYVAVKIALGHTTDWVGRLLWETPSSYVNGFNQTAYIEFDIFADSPMKSDQVTGIVAAALQKEKSTNGVLFRKGFQNFQNISSEPSRAFRFDYPWDFRQVHQFLRLFHSKLTVKTSFDVVWEDSLNINGIISQIVFGGTTELPIDIVLGVSLAYQMLEEINWGWHGGVLS